MRGILQGDRWGDRRSYAFLRGRPLRDRGRASVGVVMSPEPPENFNIERDIPDGMGPGPLAVGQIVENVPGLVNLTALDARGAPEGVVDRTAERFRAVENHQQRPVGA